MSDVMDARRDAFERKYPMLEGTYWCAERKRYVGNHLFWLYQDRWECWNAALDSVCVELPGYPATCDMTSTLICETIDQCAKAIERAGLKVKP